MKRILRRTAAISDLQEHYAFILLDSPAMAEVLLENAEHTLLQVLGHPGIGRVRSDLGPRWKDVRSCPVRGFPNHLLFYREVAKGVELMRVLHAARDIRGRLVEGR